MSFDDLNYFRARAIEERKRASTAPSTVIRTVHLKFAERYEQIAGGLRSTNELESSREAIRRSLDLLNATRQMVADC